MNRWGESHEEKKAANHRAKTVTLQRRWNLHLQAQVSESSLLVSYFKANKNRSVPQGDLVKAEKPLFPARL